MLAHMREINRVGNDGQCGCPAHLRRVSDGYLRVLQDTDLWCPRACSPTVASPRTMDERTLWRLQSRSHVDPRLDADGSAQGSYVIRHVLEHAVPRILSSP